MPYVQRSPCKEAVVLVLHGHDDEWLGSAGTVMVDMTEGKTSLLETVWATSCGRIAHVAYFALVLMDAEVEQLCGIAQNCHERTRTSGWEQKR